MGFKLGACVTLASGAPASSPAGAQASRLRSREAARTPPRQPPRRRRSARRLAALSESVGVAEARWDAAAAGGLFGKIAIENREIQGPAVGIGGVAFDST